MLVLMSEEEAESCSKLVEQLRRDILRYNSNIRILEKELADRLHPVSCFKAMALKNCIAFNKLRLKFCATLVSDLRVVLVEPPSLESRIFGFLTHLFSFRVI